MNSSRHTTNLPANLSTTETSFINLTTEMTTADSTMLENLLNTNSESLKSIEPTTATSTTEKSFNLSLTPTTSSVIQTTPVSTQLPEVTTSIYRNTSNRISFVPSTTTVSERQTTVTTVSERTTTTNVPQSTAVSVTISQETTDATNVTEFNHTEQSTHQTTILETNTTMEATKLALKQTTTDPFNNKSPFNIPRITYESRKNESYEKQTKPNSTEDLYDDGDTFWPVAMALTIGVPTIIVLAVTITVLYRRRTNKRRSLLEVYGADYQSM